MKQTTIFTIYSNFIYAMFWAGQTVHSRFYRENMRFEFLTFEHQDKNLLMTKWVFLMRIVSGGIRERGPQSPFVGWILINSTRVLAINNELRAGTREDLLCEVEKRKKQKGKRLLWETFRVWEADQPTADATANSTTIFSTMQ